MPARVTRRPGAKIRMMEVATPGDSPDGTKFPLTSGNGSTYLDE